MKPALFIALFLLTITSFCLAQTQFVRAVGGAGNDVGFSGIQTSDGGYITAGYTTSFGAGHWDLFLVKFNSSGAVEWSRAVGGTSPDAGWSVVQTTDGGYAVAGETYSYSTEDNSDLFLVKFSSSGDVEWSRAIDGTDDDVGRSVVQTVDGGYAVIGFSYSFSSGDDVFLVKFSSTGSVEWSRAVGGGGTDCDIGLGISGIQTTDSGYVVAGYAGNRSFDTLINSDLLLMKFSPTGSVEWSRAVGGTNFDMGRSVVQTSDGGYVVTGWTASFGADSSDLFLVKFNSSGVVEWARAVGGTNYDMGRSVVQTSDGGYVVAGMTASFGVEYYTDLFLVKFSSSGAVEWSRTVGEWSEEWGHSVIRTADSGYAVAGWTVSYGTGSYDLFLVKFDSEGNTCLGEEVSPNVIDITDSLVVIDPWLSTESPSLTIWSGTPTVTVVSPIETIICTSVVSTPHEHLAIIVNGGRPGWSLFEYLRTTLGCVYNALLDVGYTEEEIYVLHTEADYDFDDDLVNDVDDISSQASVQYAIETWATGLSDSSTKLLIYLGDHGAIDYFPLGIGSLTPSWLRTRIDNYCAATGADTVFIMYDACHSGSFIDELSASGKLITTSTADTLIAYAGDYDFTRLMLQKLELGHTYKEAFNWAGDLIFSVFEYEYVPLLDDNGDSYGHPAPLPNTGDGPPLASQYNLAFETSGGKAIAVLSPPNIISFILDTTSSADSILFSLQVFDASNAKKAFVWITPMDSIPTAPTDTFDGFDVEIYVEIIIDTLSRISDTAHTFTGSYPKTGLGGIVKFLGFAADSSGDMSYPSVAEMELGMLDSYIPVRYAMDIFPNPFNSAISIAYSIASESDVSLEIFDIAGHKVVLLVNEHRNAGTHSATWNAPDDIPSGIYFVKLKVDDQTIVKRAILMK